MRVALINPNWSFDGSIYFGCREPHLPLELGYAKALLERAGHEADIVDGQLFGLELDEIRAEVAAFRPDLTVVTTAPTYLFWRCAPPELRVPQRARRALRRHWRRASSRSARTARPRRARPCASSASTCVVMGECEEVLSRASPAAPGTASAGALHAGDGDQIARQRRPAGDAASSTCRP